MSNGNYRAAALQMNSQADLEYNFEQAYELIAAAAGRGCRLVCLPENFPWMGELDERSRRAGEIAGETRRFLADTASEFGIWLSGGTYPEPAEEDSTGGRVYARSPLLNPRGEAVATYDKIHLFDVDLPGGESYRESEYIRPGEPEPVVWTSEETGSLGLSVCYDLRFPELYRALSARGAQVLLVPSAFTHTTGRDHWRALLRARAVENTCWVVAAAQTGVHGRRRATWGHALIADPWGRVVDEAGTGRGMALAEIDFGRLEEVRRSIPSLKHRRMGP